METTMQIARDAGLLGKILNYFAINTYYPDTVTEFTKLSHIEFTKKSGPLSLVHYYNGVAFANFNSCFYTPKDNKTGVLSDLISDLEIDVSDFEEELPQERTHIKEVLIKIREGKDKPVLRMYKKI
jgi:hypothetical protein